MRLDLLLDRLCLFRTRSQAAKACDGSRVRLNGQVARSSRTVKVGDLITYRDPGDEFEREVEVLVVPERQVSKAQARECYLIRSERRIERPWDEGAPDERPRKP